MTRALLMASASSCLTVRVDEPKDWPERWARELLFGRDDRAELEFQGLLPRYMLVAETRPRFFQWTQTESGRW